MGRRNRERIERIRQGTEVAIADRIRSETPKPKVMSLTPISAITMA